jgi:tetratricopeptide (TPR) repeat protein
VTAGAVFQSVPNLFAALTYYLKVFLLPLGLHIETAYKQFSFSDPAVIFGLAVAGLSLIYAFKKRKSSSLIFFCAYYFFIALLPSSNINPVSGSYMAERWLYLPSIGLFIILAGKLLSLYSQKSLRPVIAALIAGIFSFYGYATISQGGYWRNPITLCKMALTHNPKSCKLYDDLAVAYMDKGENEEALKALEKALTIDQDNPSLLYNLGKAYYALGRTEEAIAAYKKAGPEDLVGYYNLGSIYYNDSRQEEAIAMFKKAIEVDKNFLRAYSALAYIYEARGDNGQAVALYKKAIENKLDYFDAYYKVGKLYSDAGQYSQAIPLFERATRINPASVEAYLSLGFSQRAAGRTKDAIRSFKRAVRLNAKLGEAYRNLAELYQSEQRDNLSEFYFKKFIELVGM